MRHRLLLPMFPSVSQSVILSVIRRHSALVCKTAERIAERIEILYGAKTLGGPGNIVWVPIPSPGYFDLLFTRRFPGIRSVRQFLVSQFC